MRTIADRLQDIPTPRGFDYIRIGLSIGVLVTHGFGFAEPLATKAWTLHSPLAPLKLIILPMFFAVSGFLVMGSLARSRTLAGYGILRVIRIVPALAMEITLSALLLGPLLTNLPLQEYFTSPLFWRYFLNIVGDPQYLLPGVFTQPPYSSPLINAQLWTLPWELINYGMIALLGFAGVFRRRRLALAALVLFVLAVCAIELTAAMSGPWLRTLPLEVACFTGAGLFLYRDHIPWNGACGAIALVAVLLLYVYPQTRTLAMLPVAYLAVWLGLWNPPASILAGKADYSYGVYLFAYPLQQLVYYWPFGRTWYGNILLSLPLALACAVVSWHLVEHRVLRRKRAAVEKVEAFAASLSARWRSARGGSEPVADEA